MSIRHSECRIPLTSLFISFSLSLFTEMSMYQRPAKSILHPTDFSPASESAFAHALAIAVENKAKLTILHVVRDQKEDVPWHEYPAVRETLERWGDLDPGASRRDIAKKLGVTVNKAVGFDTNIVKSIVGFTEINDVDLIVMATNENREQPFWMQTNVSVPVSQKTNLPTLFVPQEVRGCISESDGQASLKQILVPVDHHPDAQPVLERLVWATRNMGGRTAQVTLLHVGHSSFPAVVPPETDDLTWSTVTRGGDPATEILGMAEELDADLIAMVTEGQKGFWDAVRGSTVQRILKKAPCPVFTMPANV